MGENVVINVDFEGEEYRNDAVLNNSIQVVPVNIAWEDFQLMLKVYANQDEIHVYYTDIDRKPVKILKQQHLNMAFALAKTCNNTLHLRVQSGQPIDLKVRPPEGDTVAADIKKQCVTMTTRKNVVATPQADAVPIAMETGEHMTRNGPGCDWVVTMETGEKQCVNKPTQAKGEESKVKDSGLKVKANNNRMFFLKHKESGLVLEVKNSKQGKGAHVLLYPKKERCVDTQLWFVDDATQTLRSKSGGLCLDVSDEGGVLMAYAVDRSSQMWRLSGERISHVYNRNWVIGPAGDGGEVYPGAKVRPCEHKDTDRTAWVIVHRTPEVLDLSKSARLLKATHARQNRGLGDVLELDKEMNQLGQHVQKLEIKLPPTEAVKPKISSSERFPQKQPKKREPPAWFRDYMQELKRDLVENVSCEVASRTVCEVLRGLEGAVITSQRDAGQIMHAPSHSTSQILHSPPSADATQGDMHYGIVCDSCEELVTGVRYKCGNCEDFDLCSACEGRRVSPHPADHVFLKIRRPVTGAGQVKLLRYNLYTEENRVMRQFEMERLASIKKEEKRQARPQGKDHVDKMKKKQDRLRKKSDKTEDKLKKKEKRRLEEEEPRSEKREKQARAGVSTADHMDAEFLCDTTIPDGTHMQPLTSFVKTWKMKNTGSIPWTQGTSLVNIWSNMEPVQAEVKVKDAGVGEEISISAQIVAPSQPGTYQSHWRLSYCGLHFGHRVWCSIVVDPKEVLEEKPQQTGSPGPDLEVVRKVNEKVTEREEEVDEQIECYSKLGAEQEYENGETLSRSQGSEVKVTGEKQPEIVMRVTERDRPEIREVCTARSSQTVTPSNTPHDTPATSPPETPAPVAVWSLSRGSSVEVVTEDEEDNSVARETTSDLVSQRMAQLELKPDISLGSLSSCGYHSDSDSEEDFFVVPIPDCFNPTLPPSKEATTSVYIKKDDSCVSQPLSESRHLECRPRPIGNPSAEYEFIDTTQSGERIMSPELEEIEMLTLQRMSQKPTSNQKQGDIEPLAEQETLESEYVKVKAAENSQQELPGGSRSTCIKVKECLTTDVTEVKQRSESAMEDTKRSPEVKGVAFVEDITEVKQRSNVEENSFSEADVESRHSIKKDAIHSSQTDADVASKLVATAIDVATKATGSAYKTAKDVYQSLRQGREYVPRSSEWKPKTDEKWTPPELEEWTPLTPEWNPPEQKWPLSREPWSPKPSPDTQETTSRSSPLQMLVEMGFANRQLNKELLEKHGNNIEKVIQDLLSSNQNDWHESRH